jgi:hypothetical protein
MPTVKIAGREVDKDLVEAYADSVFWPDEYSHVSRNVLWENQHRTDLHNELLKAAGFDIETHKYSEDDENADPEFKAFVKAVEQYVKRYKPKGYEGD